MEQVKTLEDLIEVMEEQLRDTQKMLSVARENQRIAEQNRRRQPRCIRSQSTPQIPTLPKYTAST